MDDFLTIEKLTSLLDAKEAIEGKTLLSLDLTGKQLDGAKIIGGVMSELVFKHASLIQSQLREVLFDRADLDSAKLTQADCTDAIFSNLNAPKADFSKAILQNAIFSTDMVATTDPDSIEIDFEELKLVPWELEQLVSGGIVGFFRPEADLTEAIFSGANLTSARMESILLERANFKQARLTETLFQDCRLSGADFSQAKLDHTVYEFSDLTQANFHNAEFVGVQFTKCDLFGIDCTGAAMEGAIFEQIALRDVAVLPQRLARSSFIECDVENLGFSRTD